MKWAKKDCHKMKLSFYSSSLSPAGACSRDNQCETGHLRYGRNRTPPRTGDFVIIKLQVKKYKGNEFAEIAENCEMRGDWLKSVCKKGDGPEYSALQVLPGPRHL